MRTVTARAERADDAEYKRCCVNLEPHSWREFRDYMLTQGMSGSEALRMLINQTLDEART